MSDLFHVSKSIHGVTYVAASFPFLKTHFCTSEDVQPYLGTQAHIPMCAHTYVQQ